MVLVRNGELLAAMGATGSQYTTAILGGHSLTEAMLVLAATVVRLKCSFHFVLSFVLLLYEACRGGVERVPLSLMGRAEIPVWVAKLLIKIEITKNYEIFKSEHVVFSKIIVTLQPLTMI